MGATGDNLPPGKDERLRKDSTRSVVIGDTKRGSAGSTHEIESPKVNKKFINNWRHACDRTKDRTKELLKKWRTLPEAEPEGVPHDGDDKNPCWSEHVWATWVKRCPSGDGSLENGFQVLDLTTVQKEKFAQFFIHLLDMDSDEVISLFDFENLFERFRHFADWSKNSPEYHRLLEVERGFVEYFLLPPEMGDDTYSYDALEKVLRKQQLEMDEWLCKWSAMLSKATTFTQLPLWLQYFPLILFQIINKSGSGCISSEELSTFYTSVVGLSVHQVDQITQDVYNILTSNGHIKLDAHVYRLSFANYIFGRFPNGPGQRLLYPVHKADGPFPIDYKAMCCPPEDLEQYSPQVKTDRRSVIV